MAVITDIAPQKRRENRVSVYLDDEFWTGMPTDVCANLNLKVGEQITDERRDEVEREVGESSALEAAMNLLSYRDRSEQEMRKRLAEKEYGEKVIDATVRRLLDYGYLDDQDFTRQVIEAHQVKGKGRRAAEMALRRAGVSQEDVGDILDDSYSSEDEAQVAYDWAQRRADISTPESRQKLMRRLVSRGFSYDVGQQVILRLREEQDLS